MVFKVLRVDCICVFPLFQYCFCVFQERRHQEDLKLLRQRLDLLDDNQQQQLDEFQEIAHSTLRNSVIEADNVQECSKEKIDIEKALAVEPS